MKPGTILISIKSNAEVKVSDYDSGTDTFSGTVVRQAKGEYRYGDFRTDWLKEVFRALDT